MKKFKDFCPKKIKRFSGSRNLENFLVLTSEIKKISEALKRLK